jgi:fibronectin-binding autotransporter adhesin
MKRTFTFFASLCLLSVLALPNLIQAQGINITSSAYIAVTGGATIEINNGNFINNGTYTKGTETFRISGATTARTMSGSSNTDMYNLSITNAAGITTQLGLLTTNDLTIATGSKLTIDAAKWVTVNATLTNSAGTGGLIIKSTDVGTGSLKHITTNVDATIERYITGSTTPSTCKQHFVSIPLTAAATPTSNLFYGAYLFDYTVLTNSWHLLGSSTTTPLDVTKGYMICMPETSHTFTFSGKMNSSSFSSTAISFFHTDHYQGYNLVPNPYPSAIDWDAAYGWTKTGIVNSFYMWPSGGSTYATWVSGTPGVGTNGGSNIIPVGQAFIVKANALSPVLSTTDGVRVHNNLAFFKAEGIIPDLLRVKAIADEMTDEAVVRFKPEATSGADAQYDAWKLNGTEEAPQLYTVTSDNEKLAINSLPYETSSYVIPLNFEMKANAPVTFTFANIESFNPSVSIYLEDKLVNQTINLRTQSVYTFSHLPENSPIRFNLIFGGTIGIDEVESGSEANKIWLAGNTLYISTPEFAGQSAALDIFNTIGQILLHKTLTLNEFTTVNLDNLRYPSLVIVRLTTTNGKIINCKGFLKN